MTSNQGIDRDAIERYVAQNPDATVPMILGRFRLNPALHERVAAIVDDPNRDRGSRQTTLEEVSA